MRRYDHRIRIDSGHSDAKMAVTALEPTAFLLRVGTAFKVVRPRTKDDRKALVQTVDLSGEHYLGDDAWLEASVRLSKKL